LSDDRKASDDKIAMLASLRKLTNTSKKREKREYLTYVEPWAVRKARLARERAKMGGSQKPLQALRH
jgi:hypothetical protein